MRDLKSLLLELKEHAIFLEHHEVRPYLLLKGENEKKRGTTLPWISWITFRNTMM
jgi:hypothetical protein